MGKGYLAGAFWGLVMSALVIGSVSLMMPLPERERPVPQPATAPISIPDLPEIAPEDVLEGESFAPVLAPAEPPETPVPDGDEPQPDSPLPDTAPIAADPQVSAPETLPPRDAEEDAAVAAPESLAAPQPEARSAPATPEPGEEAAADMPEQVAAAVAPAAPEAALSVAPDDAADVPLAPAPPAPLPLDAGPEPQPDAESEPADDAAVPGALAAVVAPGSPERPASPEPGSATLPDVTVQSTRPAPPQPGLRNEVDGVQVGRLPAIGATEAVPETEPEVPDMPDMPAVLRHATPFEPVAGRAAFAVLLLDDGIAPEARAALVDLPFPVTVALDPLQEGAVETARAYRAAGLEVLILASGIPAGATASDLEVTFQAYFAALPEAVALLDLPDGGFQGDRRLAQLVVSVLERDGHGLITHDRGLNPAVQTAQSAGIANGVVFRLLDADDENAATIRRYLDRAAFKAAQDGRVIVLGRAAHEATLTALLEWRLEGRTDAVVLAPVTAALRMP